MQRPVLGATKVSDSHDMGNSFKMASDHIREGWSEMMNRYEQTEMTPHLPIQLALSGISDVA
jgi:hypothetical protein